MKNMWKRGAVRRLTLGCAALCLVSALAPVAQAQCVTKPAGIVAWWKAENNGLDSVGGATGTLYNGATYAAGKVGQTFTFDGVDDRISVPDATALRFDRSFSIEGWVMPTSYPATGQRGMILFRGDNRGGFDPYFLHIYPDGRINFYISSLTVSKEVLAAAPLPLNQFSHIVATLDDATGAMKLYINGQLSNSVVTGVRPFRDLDPAQNPGIGIGNHGAFPNTSFNYPFAGRIDEVSLYNRALSATEVQSLFNADSSGKCDDPPGQCAPKPASLIAWLKAENNALDSVGTNHGTLANGATYAAGQVGQAFSFDGVNDYVAIPDSSAFQPSQITIEAWVKPTTLTPGLFSGWNAVVARGAANTANNPYFLGFTDGKLVFVSTHPSNTTGDFLAASSAVSLGQWHHVAASFDGTTKSLYLDGALVASKTIASPLLYNSGSVPILIGQDIDNGIPGGAAFNGLVDEVSIYNSAVSAAELVSIYRAGSDGKCDALPSLVVNNPTSIKEGSLSVPGSATFNVKLSAASAQTVTVNYQTANGVTNGAIAGSDYMAKTGTLTFAPGEITKTVTVFFIGDSTAELNEPFFLDIRTPVNATIADSRGSTYIKNDDGPGIAIANAITVNEGNSGTTAQTFTVNLSEPSTNTITVNWSTANGTAGPADYTAASGTLTFAPGETSKVITVLVKGDTTVEPTETYRVNISNPTFAVLTDSQGVGYIRNDDVSAIVAKDEPSQ